MRVQAEIGVANRMDGSGGSLAWVSRILRDHEMPPDEISAIVSADDPDLVHRLIELHHERSEERLLARRRTLEALEPLLAKRAAERRGSATGSLAAVSRADRPRPRRP